MLDPLTSEDWFYVLRCTAVAAHPTTHFRAGDTEKAGRRRNWDQPENDQ
jgi:hypothetical protein